METQRETTKANPFTYLHEVSLSIRILAYVGPWCVKKVLETTPIGPDDVINDDNENGVCTVENAARFFGTICSVCKSWRDLICLHQNLVIYGVKLNLCYLRDEACEPALQWLVRKQIPIRSFVFDVYATQDHKNLLMEYFPRCHTAELITAHITVPKDALDRGILEADISLQNLVAERCPMLRNLGITLYTRILSVWAQWNCCPEEFPAISQSLRSLPSVERLSLVITKPKDFKCDSLNVHRGLFSGFIQDWPSLRYFQISSNCKLGPVIKIQSQTLQTLNLHKCMHGFELELDCPLLDAPSLPSEERTARILADRLARERQARYWPDEAFLYWEEHNARILADRGAQEQHARHAGQAVYWLDAPWLPLDAPLLSSEERTARILAHRRARERRLPRQARQALYLEARLLASEERTARTLADTGAQERQPPQARQAVYRLDAPLLPSEERTGRTLADRRARERQARQARQAANRLDPQGWQQV